MKRRGAQGSLTTALQFGIRTEHPPAALPQQRLEKGQGGDTALLLVPRHGGDTAVSRAVSSTSLSGPSESFPVPISIPIPVQVPTSIPVPVPVPIPIPVPVMRLPPPESASRRRARRLSAPPLPPPRAAIGRAERGAPRDWLRSRPPTLY